MPKGRKNGCPTNIRDWSVSIQDKTSVSERWVRIRGLNSMTRAVDSTTEDGSAASDVWEEPYARKRSATLSLEGKPVVDAATGDRDEGQAMLDKYAQESGCEGDATIKIVDPYGRAIVADYVITSNEMASNGTEDTTSWDLSQVGEAEELPYVQLAGVSLKDGNSAVTTLSIVVGATPKVITIVFNPTDASNQRFRISSSDRNVVFISNVTENSFTVTPLRAGSATVTVTSINNNRTASLAVTVTEGA